jgi:hypothetical protein
VKVAREDAIKKVKEAFRDAARSPLGTLRRVLWRYGCRASSRGIRDAWATSNVESMLESRAAFAASKSGDGVYRRGPRIHREDKVPKDIIEKLQPYTTKIEDCLAAVYVLLTTDGVHEVEWQTDPIKGVTSCDVFPESWQELLPAEEVMPIGLF